MTSPAQGRISTGQVAIEYQPLQYPFRADAILALEKVERQHQNSNWKYLEEQFKSAVALLTECGEQINELAAEKELAQNSADEIDEGGDTFAEFEGKVNKMASRIEWSMQKTIDHAAHVHATRQTIEEIIKENRVRSSAVIDRRNQRARQRRQEANEEGAIQPSLSRMAQDEEQEEEEELVPDPETAPTNVFRHLYKEAYETYQLKSLKARYSEHPDYVMYKQAVFGARYGPEATLPHTSTWFKTGRGSPLPGVAGATGSGNNAGDDGSSEEDNDFQVLRNKISTKCPLSLTELSEPISNRACQHIYEKSVIEEFLHTPPYATVAGKLTNYSKSCAVAGCTKVINIKDLYEDGVMIRKIKRVQAAREKEQTQAREMDDEDEQNGWGNVDDDDDPMEEN